MREQWKIRSLLEIDLAGIICIERTEYVSTKGFRLTIGKKLTIDLNELLLCQFTIGTVELEEERTALPLLLSHR